MDKHRVPPPDPLIRRACIMFGLAGLVFVGWQLRYVLVLLFGAVVVATIFRALAAPLCRYLRMPHVVAVTAAALGLISLFAAAGWLFGTRIAGQMDMLVQAMPRALSSADRLLGGAELGEQLRTWASSLGA